MTNSYTIDANCNIVNIPHNIVDVSQFFELIFKMQRADEHNIS